MPSSAPQALPQTASNEAAPDDDHSDRSYYLPMRDGVRLAVSLYFPGHITPATPTPAVLIQTRYGRAKVKAASATRSIDPWLDAGYAVAAVDVRGTTSSFGSRTCELGPDEQADMEEIIAHLAGQQWSDGRIIGTGVSYLGTTADLATARRAPAYVAAIPHAADFDCWELLWPGGIPSDTYFLSWSNDVAYALDFGRPEQADGGPVNPAHAGLDARARVEDCRRLYPALQPVDEDPDCSLLQQALMSREEGGRHWQASDYTDAAYRDHRDQNGFAVLTASTAAHLAAVRREKKPVQLWASWLDANTAEGALHRFRGAPEVPTIVIITANDHGGGVAADPFFPEACEPCPALADQFRQRLAFADDVLSGRIPERCIQYYVLGARTFRQTSVWPPAGVENVYVALDAGGALTRDEPTAGVDSYRVDFSATMGTHSRWYQFTVPTYPDRRAADRKLLTYDSAPFPEDTELAGWPVLTLRMRAATADPAIFAYLEDVDADGRVTYVTEGQLRAIHRKVADPANLPYDPGPAPHSFARADAQPVVPGEWFTLSLKLFATAALIRKGHRLRLAIAGADADSFRIMSGGEAEQFDIQRGGPEPSTLSLPLRLWR